MSGSGLKNTSTLPRTGHSLNILQQSKVLENMVFKIYLKFQKSDKNCSNRDKKLGEHVNHFV